MLALFRAFFKERTGEYYGRIKVWRRKRLWSWNRKIIDSNISDDEKRKQLDDYHESDIANVVEKLTKDERIKLYKILGNEKQLRFSLI